MKKFIKTIVFGAIFSTGAFIFAEFGADLGYQIFAKDSEGRLFASICGGFICSVIYHYFDNEC